MACKYAYSIDYWSNLALHTLSASLDLIKAFVFEEHCVYDNKRKKVRGFQKNCVFPNLLYPYPRLHICRCKIVIKFLTQFECTDTPIGWSFSIRLLKRKMAKYL